MSTGDSSDFVEVGKVDGMTCNFDLEGLQEGPKYTFRIKAENQSGTSSGTQLDKAVTATTVGNIDSDVPHTLQALNHELIP